MKKLLMVIVLLLLIVSMSYSQFGIRGGLALGTFTGDDKAGAVGAAVLTLHIVDHPDGPLSFDALTRQ